MIWCSNCGMMNPQNAPQCAGCKRPLIVVPIPTNSMLGAFQATICQVCGTSLQFVSICPRCQTPIGMVMDMADPTVTNLITVYRSLHRDEATDLNQPLSKETATTWNMGAAILTPFWAVSHGKWWYIPASLASWVAMISFWVYTQNHPEWTSGSLLSELFCLAAFIIWGCWHLFFGLRGNVMAWHSRRYPDEYSLIQSQQSWRGTSAVVMKVGSVFLLGTLALILVGYLIITFAK